MISIFLLLLLQTPPAAPPSAAAGESASPRLSTLIKEVAASGRVLSLVPVADERIRIAPGAPPLLTFRYLDGRQRGRFGGLDLVLDDAGH